MDLRIIEKMQLHGLIQQTQLQVLQGLVDLRCLILVKLISGLHVFYRMKIVREVLGWRLILVKVILLMLVEHQPLLLQKERMLQDTENLNTMFQQGIQQFVQKD